MSREGERWYDHDAGPLIRLYTLTKGRTRPSGEQFDLLATVYADPAAAQSTGLAPEHWLILRACTRPTSVADVASEVGLPLSVVLVLLGDLRDQGLVFVRQPPPPTKAPEERILQEVIQGLQAL